MIAKPKIDGVYYFLQENKIICGVVKKIYGDNELMVLDSVKDNNLYLMRPQDCYEYINDLIEDSLESIRRTNVIRGRLENDKD